MSFHCHYVTPMLPKSTLNVKIILLIKYILIFHKDKENNKIMLNVYSQYFHKPQFHIQHLRKKEEKNTHCTFIHLKELYNEPNYN